MEPEISVIVPALDEAKYIEETLLSIVNQNTNVPFELILSDNGSTDGTREIAEKYADRVIVCEEKGIGPGRHFGAMNANENSKYLLFIDADTQIPGFYLAFLYEMFKTRPELVAFSTGFRFSEQSEQIKLAESVSNKYFVMRDKLRSPTLPGFNTCVRREAYFKCGGYHNVLLEDVDFSRRINKLGTVKFFPYVKVTNSSRRLEAMGLLGTLYYYTQLDLGWELNSTWIDRLTKKLGIADLREYIGIRK
ncbi:MAG: glycosyltransferase [Candidatus Methanoperedens sp.]|nr:glycosyltransferase [Candidatus Methanoperedens sp.]